MSPRLTAANPGGGAGNPACGEWAGQALNALPRISGSTFLSGLSRDGCDGRAFRPDREVLMAKKELREALRLIDKMLPDPRVEQGQRDQLQKARRELVKLAASGKPKRRDVFRVVEMIAKVLLEIAAQEVARS